MESADNSVLCGTCQKALLEFITRTAATSFEKECYGNENIDINDEFIEDVKFFEVFDHFVKVEPDLQSSRLAVRILKNVKIDQLCQVFARKNVANKYGDTKHG